jgi:hypothetical protein
MFSNIQSRSGKLSFGRNAAKPGVRQSVNEYKNRDFSAAASGRLSKSSEKSLDFEQEIFWIFSSHLHLKPTKLSLYVNSPHE